MTRARIQYLFAATVILCVAVCVRAQTPGYGDCFLLQPPERPTCFEAVLEEGPLEDPIDSLSGLIEDHAEALLQLVQVVRQRAGAEWAQDPSTAPWLELQARALSAMGRGTEAVEVWKEALDLDDGTTRLVWLDPELDDGWEVAVGHGEGRIERAATAAIEAGETSIGRVWLARALRLGAGERARELWERSGAGSVPGLDPHSTALTIAPWFRPLPDVEIPIFDDEPFLISQARGKVLILDFWATWCAPCATELPLLQELLDAEEDRGVLAIAVNGQEPPEFALPYAEELGLRMPIGRYTKELDKVYLVKELPTLLIADQRGRLRERWNGYTEGLEDRVAEKVRELLDNGGLAGPVEPVARQVYGAGLFGVLWSRQLEGRIGGLEIVDAPSGEARVLLSLGRTIGVYGRGGMTIRKWKSETAAAALRRGARDADRDYGLVGFRPGGTRFVRFGMPEGAYLSHEAPAPVLDVIFAGKNGPGAEALIGTTAGLFVHDGAGLRALDHPSQVLDLDRVETKGDPRMVLLSSADSGERTARFLNDEFESVGERPVPANAFRMVVDAETEGFGVVPFAVAAHTSGAFLEPGKRQAALATRGGQLVLVDLESGRERFRSDWPGVTDLAAGDADGDGLDELFVVSGRRIVVLSVSNSLSDP